MTKIDPTLQLTGLPPAPPMWTGEWRAPAFVERQGDRLVYGPSARTVKAETKHDLLFAFASLWLEDDSRITGFARRWGVLGICAHELPATHIPWRLMAELEDLRPCEPRRAGLSGRRWEPLERWRYYSRQAHALIRAVAAVREQTRVSDDCWDALSGHFPSDGYLASVGPARAAMQRSGTSLEPLDVAEKRLMDWAVQRWLDLADARLTFHWKGAHPTTELGSPSLFGALAIQLALVTGNIVTPFICSFCSEPFVPREGRRRPRSGERTFCDACREDGSAARASHAEASRRVRRPDPIASIPLLRNFD